MNTLQPATALVVVEKAKHGSWPHHQPTMGYPTVWCEEVLEAYAENLKNTGRYVRKGEVA